MSEKKSPRLYAYIAQSIDGYIAKENGDQSWLAAMHKQGEDYGFKTFLNKIDLIVMGRKTYELLLKVYKTAQWPYEGKRILVLSRKLKSVIEEAELYAGPLKPLVDKLARQQVRHIWVDGGATLSQFISLGLMDEMTLSIVPILLGGGTPLFSLDKEVGCQLVGSKSYPSGLVQNSYRFDRKKDLL